MLFSPYSSLLLHTYFPLWHSYLDAPWLSDQNNSLVCTPDSIARYHHAFTIMKIEGNYNCMLGDLGWNRNCHSDHRSVSLVQSRLLHRGESAFPSLRYLDTVWCIIGKRYISPSIMLTLKMKPTWRIVVLIPFPLHPILVSISIFIPSRPTKRNLRVIMKSGILKTDVNHCPRISSWTSCCYFSHDAESIWILEEARRSMDEGYTSIAQDWGSQDEDHTENHKPCSSFLKQTSKHPNQK